MREGVDEAGSCWSRRSTTSSSERSSLLFAAGCTIAAASSSSIASVGLDGGSDSSWVVTGDGDGVLV